MGQQRNCATSHLYWYTDLNEAKAAARELNKPILSLRLLGRLTDEYSCANSRFFRSTLYSNELVSRYLKSHFVLHWQSERPVPVVTIDFGDGRKLQRTVTGNSVHYVLDADGQPVDALPGLYGPEAFLRTLAPAEQMARSLADDGVNRVQKLAVYHRQQLAELRKRWSADLFALGKAGSVKPIAQAGSAAPALPGPGAMPAAQVSQAGNAARRNVPLQVLPAANHAPVPQAALPQAPVFQAPVPQQVGPLPEEGTAPVPVAQDAAAGPPRAVKASIAARPKHAAEAPILAAALNVSLDSLASATGEAEWGAIAQLHAGDAQLDPASRRLIGREHPTAAAAEPRTVTKGFVETPLVRMLRNFQQAIALDTVRNEYLLHRQIHEWFVTNSPANLEALNARVYAELFLTPATDPWLGLVPPDTYTALENCGISRRPAE